MQGNPQIVGNLVQDEQVGAPAAAARYTNATWPNDQYAQVKVITATVGTSRQVGGICRGSSTAATYYRGLATGPLGTGASVTIAKVINGAFTTLTTVGTTINSGDTVLFEVQGTTLRVKINGVEISSTTDSAIASGSAGCIARVDNTGSPNVAHAQFDDWEGGDFVTALILQSSSSSWPRRGQFAALLAH